MPSQSEKQGFDRCSVLDGEIFVHTNAQSFIAIELGRGIKIVDEWLQKSATKRIEFQAFHRFKTTATECWQLTGFHMDVDVVVKWGMLIYSSGKHRESLEDWSQNHLMATFIYYRSFHHEQSVREQGLQDRRLARLLAALCNCTWPLDCTRNSVTGPKGRERFAASRRSMPRAIALN
jgi:hypothetical protein